MRRAASSAPTVRRRPRASHQVPGGERAAVVRAGLGEHARLAELLLPYAALRLGVGFQRRTFVRVPRDVRVDRVELLVNAEVCISRMHRVAYLARCLLPRRVGGPRTRANRPGHVRRGHGELDLGHGLLGDAAREHARAQGVCLRGAEPVRVPLVVDRDGQFV
eukprot:CAMPEP_0180152350 /NCGR_PEP_ID=MMETSP0986-20121125/22737_1 /TAXON_ID=697907 /ORGANISM="non described non described, Strain CCMP2293" /LENGTH=162 /DNA_ID=CAMNT_0022099949 /DNA_START=223 /DNA_END=708 /DNA_ORIENTATION=+